MVEAIIKKGGDYGIALKGNWGIFAVGCTSMPRTKANNKYPVAKTETSGQGRVETCIGMVVETKGLAEYHELPA